MGKKILVVGGGGREHALAWKLSQSTKVDKIFVSPGNGMPSEVGETIHLNLNTIERLADFAEKSAIDITVVGPENFLAQGIVDLFQERGLKIFGPAKAASEIEWSKAYAKNFMLDERIPTTPFWVFYHYDEARTYVSGCKFPVVIKASGLASGKGSYVCQTPEQAEHALIEVMLQKRHGTAGDEVIIEDFAAGSELSIHVICDGQGFKIFPAAQDYKRLMDQDRGPNTGGMGAVVPVPWVKQLFTCSSFNEWIAGKIVVPTLKGLKKRNRQFSGCLYPGLKGWRVLEFNARFGDPETEVYMRLLETDLLNILEACINGCLDEIDIRWLPGYAVCVVAVAKGYPYSYRTCQLITGIKRAEEVPGVQVFHASTSRDELGNVYTAGGRILAVTGHADTLSKAVENVYEAIKHINFPGMYYRRDIANEAIL